MRLAAVLGQVTRPAVDRPATEPVSRSAEPAPYLKRLPTAASPHEQSTSVKEVAPAAEVHTDTPEDEAVVAEPPTIEDHGAPAFDEAAESAFRAEAKDRGEAVAAPSTVAAAEPVEEPGSKKPLPKLDDLVNQIPADVRDVLEDLFRARFVSVKRFPKKVMK